MKSVILEKYLQLLWFQWKKILVVKLQKWPIYNGFPVEVQIAIILLTDYSSMFDQEHSQTPIRSNSSLIIAHVQKLTIREISPKLSYANE